MIVIRRYMPFKNYYELVVIIITWYQKYCCINKISVLCKPPEPLSFTGNVVQNWQEFVEQLQWYLEGTESTDNGEKVKIGIMLSHAGKGA